MYSLYCTKASTKHSGRAETLPVDKLPLPISSQVCQRVVSNIVTQDKNLALEAALLSKKEKEKKRKKKCNGCTARREKKERMAACKKQQQ